MEITVTLSRSIPATVSRRNPGHAGGGLETTKPALPPPDAPSSRARNDARQPGLSAAIRRARSSFWRGGPGGVQKRIDLGDRHLLGSRGNLEDLITRPNPALLEHAQVKAGTAVRDQQRRNPRILHPNPHPITRGARLSDLEKGGADP